MKSQTKISFWRWVAPAIVALSLLNGCGGGGSSEQSKPNTAPSLNVTLAGEVRAGATGANANATVGRDVLLNGSNSTDAEGDPLTFSWSVVSKPANSTVTIAPNSGAVITIKPDVAGAYTFSLKVTDSKGASSEQRATLMVDNNPPVSAPVVVVVGNAMPPSPDGSQSSIDAAVGYLVSLNGDGSVDPTGSLLSYTWAMVHKPAASTAQLSSTSSNIVQFSPDVLGDYVVKLTVTNSRGESSYHTAIVSTKNSRPVASISSNVTPVALPAGPAIRLPANSTVTLRGGASSDADGDAITYAWNISKKPVGSATALSSASTVNVQLTPDLDGSYVVVLRTTDPSGAYSEQQLNIEVGNYAPVAVVDRGNLTTLLGGAVTASAALSYDEEGDSLSYSWALDARPAGSSATIGSTNTSTLNFTPDVVGTYAVSVTVSDGKRSSIAYVNVRVLASIASSVALPFAPLDTRYSRGLDRLVSVVTNPNALKIVDPFTGGIKTVLLPMSVKSLQLSPDGKLAAVLHEGILSLIDLQTATLVRSSATGGSHTDAFLTNGGIAYLVGQTGGQWVRPAVVALDARTGATVSELDYGMGQFYGTQKGVFAQSKNKGFLMTNGLSPLDISYFTVDPKTNKLLTSGDSPYHGDFSMQAPLFLSETEDLLFTAAGTYFQTSTLKYAGRFTFTGQLASMSHSIAMDEALVIATTGGSYPTYLVTYPSAYKRYTGALLLPAADLVLPLIGGQQSYGIGIYHSADGHHIALVQTGSAEQNASGIQYFLTYR
jgi:hypothetical protein